MKKIIASLAGVLVLSLATLAGAATYDFSGTINYHNDVRQFGFSLANNATNVRVWTDSFDSGANFDPITALWTASGNLIRENDDNSSINPATQTYWDSGFSLASLAAGDYFFTVARYANFANGTTLAEGFRYDDVTPISIQNGYYHVILDGVDSATDNNVPVPEPSTMLLLGGGLAGLAFWRKRKSA